ncbi:MAG: glutathione transferase [Actinomyces sp.]|uniref:glutathione S-transferase C-terminal domain-containing protein n=1 Tax=Actinomyces sp. TaxID=29317 RepID=UPI0026DB4847|nr:glutathione S-transferase C-terminal domain-containing protein [Actinomyces sp.]MDO4242885.1 glutathione transferase [Actinomyces sp.]
MAIAHSHRFAEGDLPVEAGRYRLVASGSCPWSRRVLIGRRLLGLVDAIPVSWCYGRGVDGFWELTGPTGEPGIDPALGARSIAEVYEGTPGYAPPPTVPALVDMTSGEVVVDDSGTLLFDLATAWWPLHRPGAPELYPVERRNSTDAWDEWIGEHVNGAHSTATHSTNTEEAAAAANDVLVAFDVIDTLLARATKMEASREAALTIQDAPPLSAVVSIGQFLCGDKPTGSDIRLFTTVQAYEYGGRSYYPGGEAPSVSFWPALARWFRALEGRPGWVGPEERSALGL